MADSMPVNRDDNTAKAVRQSEPVSAELAELRRKVHIGRLLEVYRGVLSGHIAEIMELYTAEDYSLSEIAQAKGITRQAAYDAVKRGEAQLTDMENKLKVCEKTDAALSLLDKYLSMAQTANDSADTTSQGNLVKLIEEAAAILRN